MKVLLLALHIMLNYTNLESVDDVIEVMSVCVEVLSE